MAIKIGTAGWSYDDWKGGFYPKNLPASQYLGYYAKYFDFTEINTTFYDVPKKEMLRKWLDDTPENFQFSVKIWQEITHKLRRDTVEDNLALFFSHLEILSPKISRFLLQFPPFFKLSEKNFENLAFLISKLPENHKYAIELRSNRWFESEDLLNLLKSSKITFVTTYKPGLKPFFVENQSDYYIRLIGDRVLTKFNRIQRNEPDIIQEIVRKVGEFKVTPDITDIFVIFNNHFRGFAIQDVYEFKRLLGMKVKKYSPQSSLNDFL